ncbi:MAG: UbiA family prenyltransferase [Phycisphaerales bacterium]|nr:UbiA family prenyltransferase [Phycisphaerales bacterium]
MQRFLVRIITGIQLTRLTMAFGAVSDVWFVILLTREQGIYSYLQVYKMDLAAALLAGATVAIGLFAHGAALNDVLDLRHDSAFSPERPIPAGRIRLGQAIVITVGALIIATLGAAILGSLGAVGMTLLTATGILFYNAAGKYIPAVGITTVGLIHAAHMLIPNHQLAFTLPVWLVMTHSMVIAAIVHHLEDKRPRLHSRAIAATIIGWIIWSVIVLGAPAIQGEGIWPDDAPVLGIAAPVVAIIAFVAVAWWKASGVTGRASAEKLKRYGAMWQAWYGAAWLLALNLPGKAAAMAALAIAGFVAMTLIKEITGFSDRPVTYR